MWLSLRLGGIYDSGGVSRGPASDAESDSSEEAEPWIRDPELLLTPNALLEQQQGSPQDALAAGAERGPRLSQRFLNPHRGRVRSTQHAPRDPSRVLERRHGLTEVVERRAVVLVSAHASKKELLAVCEGLGLAA